MTIQVPLKQSKPQSQQMSKGSYCGGSNQFNIIPDGPFSGLVPGDEDDLQEACCKSLPDDAHESDSEPEGSTLPAGNPPPLFDGNGSSTLFGFPTGSVMPVASGFGGPTSNPATTAPVVGSTPAPTLFGFGAGANATSSAAFGSASTAATFGGFGAAPSSQSVPAFGSAFNGAAFGGSQTPNTFTAPNTASGGCFGNNAPTASFAGNYFGTTAFNPFAFSTASAPSIFGVAGSSTASVPPNVFGVASVGTPGALFGNLPQNPSAARKGLRVEQPPATKGRASAARVSRGDLYGKHKGLPVTAPKRSPDEHVTVTCVLYNTVIDGIPNDADVLAAIDDMEKLYAACSESGRLADAAFDFMKTELTVGNVMESKEKASTQPRVAETPPAIFNEPVSSPTERELVLSKLSALDVSFTSRVLLEVKLLTLGALHNRHEAQAIVSDNFQCIRDKLESNDLEGAQTLVLELKLILMGALQA